MSSDIVWEDPPEVGLLSDGFVRHKAMRENPGRWLLWGTFKSGGSAASVARHLRVKHQELEVCRAGVKVYARYVRPAEVAQ